MRLYNYNKIIMLSIIFLLFSTCFVHISLSKDDNTIKQQNKIVIEGQILYSPMNDQTTFLIDNTGSVIHTWESSYSPGQAVYMIEDNFILRTIRKTYNAPGGAGGGIQKMNWDGDVIWDFNYYNSEHLSHHDVEPLTNGNVLMIAWEYISRDEAIAAGRNPNFLQGNVLMPDHIIEVEPTGSSSGNIVWEWHVMDHLIQDYDPTKDNYGVVEDHPELVDFNFGTSNKDWLHCNSIDYNEEFDQILISVHNMNEIWIIDHSTTTEEAAGHAGGNYGMGGDLLYRWGNPLVYRAGTTNDQKLFNQHDTNWIESGFPGEGNILIFNNGNGRPGVDYSSVDEIILPVDEFGYYYLEPGSSYGPDDAVWSYSADNPSSFFAFYISGAQRLKTGNTLICDGPEGRFFEVTPEKVTIWEYVNPYPNWFNNNVFKIFYIPNEETPENPDLDCYGNLNWGDVERGESINGSFIVQNIGGTGSLLNWEISEYPEWGTWTFTPESGEGLSPEDGQITVQVSIITPLKENTEFEGYIKVINQENPVDYDIIPVYLKTPRINFVKEIFTENTKFFQFIFKNI